MRLGLVVEQLLAPVPGGTGRYARELAAAVAARAGPNDIVRGVVGWHRDTSVARIAGVDGPTRLPLPAPLLARAWQRGLPPHLGGHDVVHAPTPLAPRTTAALVVTVHDAVPWTHPQTLTAHGVAWHRAIIQRAVADGACLVTPTHAVAADLCEVLPVLGPDRVRVLGGGVAAALLAEVSEPERDRVLRVVGVPADFLLTVATLEPRKGLDIAIKALARLGPAAPTLVVVGQPGWGRQDARALAEAAGIGDKLLVLGPRSDAELGVLLRAARALVMPSLAEGFGLPVAEAMALGTPVICTAVPALLEVSGGAALTVPPSDVEALAQAIETTGQDEQLLTELSRRGRVQAERHSWSAVADRAWALYRELA